MLYVYRFTKGRDQPAEAVLAPDAGSYSRSQVRWCASSEVNWTLTPLLSALSPTVISPAAQ